MAVSSACMPPPHTPLPCTPLPCMTPATYAPLPLMPQCHIHTPATHTPVMHAPCHACPLPCTPPEMHIPATHTPTMHTPCEQNDWQTGVKTSFAGGYEANLLSMHRSSDYFSDMCTIWSLQWNNPRPDTPQAACSIQPHIWKWNQQKEFRFFWSLYSSFSKFIQSWLKWHRCI